MLMAQLLLLSSVAFGGDKPASCELASKGIVSRSSSGLAQVSNLGDIQIACRVPARPFPTKPGETHIGLRAASSRSSNWKRRNRSCVQVEKIHFAQIWEAAPARSPT